MSDKALARAGELKRRLVEFGQGERFAREMRRQLRRTFGELDAVRDQMQAIRLVDWFILEHTLPDGKTVLDRFIREDRNLSTQDKDMLLRWKGVVEGIFEVEEYKKGAFLLHDLVDDCRYVVRSNMGPQALVGAEPGSFLYTRIVPLEDYWMVSGATERFSSSERDRLYRLANEQRINNPSRVFKRNPAKLKQAWDLQAEYRAEFIDFFGSDLVIAEGASLARQWAEFNHYRTFDRASEKDGLTVAERARRLGITPHLTEATFPAELTRADTVGIIFDEKEGINYYRDFGLFQEAFQRPELARESKYREVIWGYLKSETISTLPFRRMAQVYPSNSESVLGTITGKADFHLEPDFERLMRRYKNAWINKTIYPSIMPVETARIPALKPGKVEDAGQPPSLSSRIERLLDKREGGSRR